tara:strand:+ start:1391 stop:1576 length:186 start_codon:yes stop_codon:yes gene_type:complete
MNLVRRSITLTVNPAIPPGTHDKEGIMSQRMIEMTELLIITTMKGIRMIDAIIPMGLIIPK